MNSPAGNSTNRGSSSSRIGSALSILAGMRVEPFAMERFQSTWEHQVRFNLSESGVHPLSVARARRRGRGARCGARPAARSTRRPTAPRRCAPRSPRLYPGAGAEPRRGDQRRRRGQLPRRLVSGAARRRGGGARAHLHADARPGARLRRRGARVAAGRGPRGGTLASGSRSARRRWSGRAPAPSCCARPTTRPGPASPPRSSTRSRRWPRGTAAGSSPTRSTAAPSSTASTRRRCGAAPSGSW